MHICEKHALAPLLFKPSVCTLSHICCVVTIICFFPPQLHYWQSWQPPITFPLPVASAPTRDGGQHLPSNDQRHHFLACWAALIDKLTFSVCHRTPHPAAAPSPLPQWWETQRWQYEAVINPGRGTGRGWGGAKRLTADKKLALATKVKNYMNEK